MNLVTVRKSEDGLTIRTSKNPLYGFVVMEQKGAFTVSATGWVDIKSPTCLIQGSMEHLKAMEDKLNAGLVGKIVHKESLEPFNLKNPANDIKYASVSSNDIDAQCFLCVCLCAYVRLICTQLPAY